MIAEIGTNVNDLYRLFCSPSNPRRPVYWMMYCNQFVTLWGSKLLYSYIG